MNATNIGVTHWVLSNIKWLTSIIACGTPQQPLSEYRGQAMSPAKTNTTVVVTQVPAGNRTSPISNTTISSASTSHANQSLTIVNSSTTSSSSLHAKNSHRNMPVTILEAKTSKGLMAANSIFGLLVSLWLIWNLSCHEYKECSLVAVPWHQPYCALITDGHSRNQLNRV